MAVIPVCFDEEKSDLVILMVYCDTCLDWFKLFGNKFVSLDVYIIY